MLFPTESPKSIRTWGFLHINSRFRSVPNLRTLGKLCILLRFITSGVHSNGKDICVFRLGSSSTGDGTRGTALTTWGGYRRLSTFAPFGGYVAFDLPSPFRRNILFEFRNARSHCVNVLSLTTNKPTRRTNTRYPKQTRCLFSPNHRFRWGIRDIGGCIWGVGFLSLGSAH